VEKKKEVKEVVMMVILKVELMVMGVCCGDESEDGGDREGSIRGEGDAGEVMVVVMLKFVKMVELSLE